MPITPLPYLIVDGTPHVLDRIEVADEGRLRLVFTDPAPELRDRVHYAAVEGPPSAQPT